ncbi:NAD(P)-dependent dehydrogenase (short-subunit alcohol dehydrogenase family) [Antricoccus suffuscus]|uniref:NAD(P)-dependent dehydrogenase (Short-subunit alcohol dehydrogenase family) n=1 Tax=Antricoccus suffuscus TaxID=1629062 RepID=A0A2T0ZQL1_9ACTN|nr:SDR family NAD(P)-dependent oxidoreductase [Antricoccus suffuscus]PRZ38605.1 NAD(P)-dependent dehydrogenase (short-subunit alcohol dehydrogenase family) [Antricoccus suffuscus]
MDLSAVSALVTGGASGLGEATVRALHAKGASVTIVDLAEEKGQALAAELGGATTYVKTDVTNPDQVQAAVDDASSKDSPLRVVVNCAGIGYAKRTLTKTGPHDLESFQKVININLVGTFNVLRLAAAAMATTAPLEDDARGVIINTASVAAFEGQIGQIAYATSKAGIHGMTLPAARDLSSVGIRVNTIAPGIIDTPMLAGVTDEFRKTLGDGVPFPKRIGRPSEYAQIAVFLGEHDYINGETIRFDAALRMAPR